MCSVPVLSLVLAHRHRPGSESKHVSSEPNVPEIWKSRQEVINRSTSHSYQDGQDLRMLIFQDLWRAEFGRIYITVDEACA